MFLPTGTEGYLPQFLIRHLDRRIEKNAEIRAPLKSLKRIGLLGIYFGASAVAQGASGDIVACVLNAFCALTVFVISGWDYLAFIKTHPESVPESEPTFLDEAKRYFHDRSKQRQVVAGFVFLSVVTAFGVMWVPGAIPGIIVVWAILPAGFWLDIIAYRWKQRDEQIRQEGLSQDGLLDERELEPASPWEFLDQLKKMPVVEEGEMELDRIADEVKTSPLGVTESTTKSLSFDSRQDLNEPVETRKLISHKKESGFASGQDLNESVKTQRLSSGEKEAD